MKRADRSGAVLALILGDDEVAARTITVKPLREETEQSSIPWSGINDAVGRYLNEQQDSG